MSLPIKIKLVSGSFSAEPKAFKRGIDKLFVRSIIDAWDDYWDDIKDDIPEASRAFIKAVRAMIDNQVSRIKRSRIGRGLKANIRFMNLTGQDYFKYLLVSKGARDRSYRHSRAYQRSKLKHGLKNKLNTRPLNEARFMRELKISISAHLRSNMTQQGLKFTQVIKFG